MIADQQIVALEALLRPISTESPAGRSLRYDPIYDGIREARRAEDATAPSGIWERDLKSADWNEVRRRCEDALVGESKDLQIAAWLMEAWFHVDGLEGLRRGVELLLQLSEGYWETAHPRVDEGAEYRASPFLWINEKFTASIGRVVLVSPVEKPELEATWDQWKRALWLEKVGQRSEVDEEIRAERETGLDLEEFRRRSQQTAESFFHDRIAVTGDAVDTVRSLEALLDDRLGHDSPSLVRFRRELEEIRTWCEVALRDGAFRAEAPTEEPDSDGIEGGEEMETSGSAGAVAPVSEGPIQSRADAYRRLREAAAYLKRVEPHSPTPYLVEKAVSWGDKSLDDLLREFVSEGLNLEALFTFLGIEPGQP